MAHDELSHMNLHCLQSLFSVSGVERIYVSACLGNVLCACLNGDVSGVPKENHKCPTSNWHLLLNTSYLICLNIYHALGKLSR